MKIKFLTLTCCFFLVQSIWAQQTTIKGVVTDANHISLPGASVIIKGTTTGVQADFDGAFTLRADTNDILVISYLGYVTQEVTVASSANFTIALQEDLNKLDEVIVVGYGTQKKNVLTSSVSSIKGEELSKEPIINATQALQGKAAGVQIIASDAPGEASTVIIRGLGTINGSNDPLYVVDGILTNNINNINTYDILTMNILKDAAASAIYGNRAANGVIIITTKRGRSGKMKISFNANTGARYVLSKVKMADAGSYVTYSNEAALRNLRLDDNPNNDHEMTVENGFIPTNQAYNTDWLDAITRLGRMSNYNLSISGGTESVKAFFSIGLNDEEGILKGNDFNRLTLRSNVDYKISDKLDFSHNVSFQLAKLAPKNKGVFTSAYRQAPIVPVRDENGRFGSGVLLPNNVANPVSQLFFQDEAKRYFKIQGSIKVNYKIIEPLVFTSRFSIDTEYGRFHNYENILGSFLAQVPTNAEADFYRGDPDRAFSRLTVEHNNNYHWFLDNYLTFKKALDDNHNIQATLGITSEESNKEGLIGKRINVPTNSNLRYNLNTGDSSDQISQGTFDVKSRLYSYFARANYDYKSKYLFNASFRRDGSSKFTQGSPLGNFYGVSVGWVLTEEGFMEDGVFDVLKLRGSYGELGNQNIGFQVVNVTTGDGGFYAFGSNQEIQEGTTISSTISPDLTWEKLNEYNIGAEFSLFNYKLNGEVDFYVKTNTNAILKISPPDVLGLSPYDDHVGTIENKGVEFMLKWKDVINDTFSYRIGVNASFNENELTKVSNPFFEKSVGGSLGNGEVTKRVETGQPLGSFYLFEVAGIDDKGAFVYKDLNGDGNIDSGDKKFMGSPIPKYNIGFNFGADYKGFDLNVDTYTSLGAKVYNGKRAQRFGKENIEQSVFNNRWTSGRPSNTTPIASNDVPLPSDYYLESGDFFRINNITLGYTLPKKTTTFFSKVRIYATAKNPLIFKKFSGFSPELPGNPLELSGIELDAYPTLRSFFIGINTSF